MALAADDLQAITTAVTASLAPLFDKLATALVPEPLIGDDTDPADGDDPARVRNEAATPSGDNVMVPGVIPAGMVSAADHKKALDQLDALQAKWTRSQYMQTFEAMEREGIVLDRGRELEKVLSLPESHREAHLQTIRTCYARRPAGWKPSEAPPIDEKAERQGVIDYAVKHGLKDITEARARYHADRNRDLGPVELSRVDRQGIIDFATKHEIFDPTEARAAYFHEKYGKG